MNTIRNKLLTILILLGGIILIPLCCMDLGFKKGMKKFYKVIIFGFTYQKDILKEEMKKCIR